MNNWAEIRSVFYGKRVLLTGDTGFKGSWLALWLADAGAHVYGYALPPEHKDAHFHLLKLEDKIHHCDGDIRDLDQLSSFFNQVKPDFVFHLAAQALVRRSYDNPKETCDTNIGGSINILDCVRRSDTVSVLIYITSDKCYANQEWIWGYRETDTLGGADPYSASKAAAELIFSAYSKSFFQSRPTLGYASVRAGNVIGGGDWSPDRIVPDCVHALRYHQPIVLRKPHATRPWQHVLEPLSGYLTLAAALSKEPSFYSGAWNFGPHTGASRSVLDVANTIITRWGSGEIQIQNNIQDQHEANLLQLDCNKANHLLHWQQQWNFNQTIEKTIDWYLAFLAGEPMFEISLSQLQEYTSSNKQDGASL